MCFEINGLKTLKLTILTKETTNNKRELQNIAIDHSANVDYQDFMKIYTECT